MAIESYERNEKALYPAIAYKLTDEYQDDYRNWIGDGGSRTCSMAIALAVLKNINYFASRINEDTLNKFKLLPIWTYGFLMPDPCSNTIMNFLLSTSTEAKNIKELLFDFENKLLSEEGIDEEILEENDVYKNYIYLAKRLFQSPSEIEPFADGLFNITVVLDPIPGNVSYGREMNYFREMNSSGNGMATFERMMGCFSNETRYLVNHLRYVNGQKVSDKLMKSIFVKLTGKTYTAAAFKKWEDEFDDVYVKDNKDALEKMIVNFTNNIVKIYNHRDINSIINGCFSETMLAGLLIMFEKFSDDDIQKALDIVIPFFVQAKYCSLILNSRNATYTTPLGKYIRDNASKVSNVEELKVLLLNFKYDGINNQANIFRNRGVLWANYSRLYQKFRIKDTFDFIFKFIHNIEDYKEVEGSKKFKDPNNKATIGGFETDGSLKIDNTEEKELAASEAILAAFDVKLSKILQPEEESILTKMYKSTVA